MKCQPYIDNTAIVHPSATIGAGSFIWNWSKIRENAFIGENVNIGQHCYVDFDVKIGEGSKIQNGVSVYHGITIEDGVFIGPNATFTNDLRPRSHNDTWEVTPTIIKKGASIGANATIICGITLNEHCMIAAGSVVTKDVPPFAMVRGNPARVIKFVTINGTDQTDP